MLTEIETTLWTVLVEGRPVATNLPSRQLAEHTLFSLPPEKRSLAEIVPVTPQGKTVLFG